MLNVTVKNVEPTGKFQQSHYGWQVALLSVHFQNICSYHASQSLYLCLATTSLAVFHHHSLFQGFSTNNTTKINAGLQHPNFIPFNSFYATNQLSPIKNEHMLQ